MGIITNSIPTWLAGALQREFDIGTFVETGLGQGTSALWAEKHFDKCFSIEITQIYIERFLNEQRQSKVMIIGGGSEYKLIEIVRALSAPALFWLDGHTDDDCPVMDELAAINSSQLDHIILIDDARLFGTVAAWPTREQVNSAAEADGRRVVFEVDDVIVAVPIHAAMRVGRIIHKR